MQIIRLSQRDDREVWLEERRGKATGSKAKGLYPLSRGTDTTPQGVWDLVGEMLSKQPDPENPIDRGQRLEREGIAKVAQATGLPFTDDAGMWVSDDNGLIAVSPDGAEPGNAPTYAAEIKCLGAGKHFKYLYRSLYFVGNPLDLVPNEAGSFYRQQALQYFVVNEQLETLYFGLYNPDAAFVEHELVLLTLKRQDVMPEVEDQALILTDAVEHAQRFVKDIMTGVNYGQES